MKKLLTIALYLSLSAILAISSDTIKIKSKISSTYDDAEEDILTGKISLYSSDLELFRDGLKEQIVGLRFKNIKIPKDATIINAYLQFTSDEINIENTNIIIDGELNANPKKFKGQKGDISNREKTATSISWNSVPAWTNNRERGDKQKSCDISSIVQEIIEQDKWHKGNAMAFILSGDGKRVAKSFNGSKSLSPTLFIEYTDISPIPSYKGVAEIYGKLSDAKVKIYEIDDDGNMNLKWTENTSTGAYFLQIGYFDTHSNELNPNNFYLFVVQGGMDYYEDDDGAIILNSQNSGTIRAIAKGNDIISVGDNFKITPISEILYEKVEAFLKNDFDKDGLSDILNQESKLIVDDINLDGEITIRDILSFNTISETTPKIEDWSYIGEDLIDKKITNMDKSSIDKLKEIYQKQFYEITEIVYQGETILPNLR
ncbi:MAG: hypothetical protein GXO60_09425 [Epsilonproteobacteria bacterium]|nr:hypothetical protein [Campylobacterota bacterium]